MGALVLLMVMYMMAADSFPLHDLPIPVSISKLDEMLHLQYAQLQFETPMDVEAGQVVAPAGLLKLATLGPAVPMCPAGVYHWCIYNADGSIAAESPVQHGDIYHGTPSIINCPSGFEGTISLECGVQDGAMEAQENQTMQVYQDRGVDECAVSNVARVKAEFANKEDTDHTTPDLPLEASSGKTNLVLDPPPSTISGGDGLLDQSQPDKAASLVLSQLKKELPICHADTYTTNGLTVQYTQFYELEVQEVACPGPYTGTMMLECSQGGSIVRQVGGGCVAPDGI